MLTAFYNLLPEIADSDNPVMNYWRARCITAETLNVFGVRVWDGGREHSIIDMLAGRGFEEQQIRAHLYAGDGTRPLFNDIGSILPVIHDGTIWNFMYVSVANKKLYCKGIHLAWPFNIDSVLGDNQPVVVCEAPIDAMAAWQLEVQNVISTFGVNFQNLDFSALSGRPITVLFDNDAAGVTGSYKFLQKYPGSKLCFIPKEYGKDCADLLNAGGTPEILRKIIECTAAATVSENPAAKAVPAIVPVTPKGKGYDFFGDCRNLFFDFDEEGKAIKRNPTTYEIVNGIYTYYTGKNGHFICDKSRGTATLFLDDGSVICLDLNNRAARNWLFEQIQIVSMASAKGKEIITALVDYLFDPARSTIVESVYFSTYDRENRAAYFYTGDDTILRVSPGEVKPLRNGLNEHKIGLIGPTFPFKSWRFDPTVTKTDAIRLLFDLYVKSLALDEIDALISLAFNLTHLSPDLSIRVCRENTGASSSGKSEETKLWGTIIYGQPTLGCFRTEDEAFIACSYNPYIVLDNTEDSAVDKYFMLLTSGVTGGSAQKRKLFSDEQLLTYSMHGQVTITCIRGNSWQEVIQRTVSFPFDSQHHRADYNYQKVLTAIKENRAAILSGIFRVYGEDVLPFKEDYNSFADHFLKSINHPRRRLNPFLREKILWLAAISKCLGMDWESIARTFFARSIEQYRSDVVDSDMVMQCLSELKETLKEHEGIRWRRKTKVTTSRSILTIEGFAADFFHDFLQVNKSRTERFFKTPKSLGQRLKSIENEVIKTIGWSIARDDSKPSKGIYYRFTYDLNEDAGGGIHTNVEKLMKELTEKSEKEDKKVIRLEKPLRNPAEILSMISGEKATVIEIPSLRFLGPFALEVADIIERSKIPIIIDCRKGWTEDPAHRTAPTGTTPVGGDPSNNVSAAPASLPALKNGPALVYDDSFFDVMPKTGTQELDDQSDDLVRD
jgi:5S rRNA maturation endonuclease (ribonuclease M5)